MLLGAFAGTIPAALLADRFSRRMAIFISSIIFLFGGALQTGSQSGGQMLAGRFFAGYGIGSLGMLAPLYQAEIAHPSHRGRITTLFQFSLGLGAFIASWVVYGCNLHQSGKASEWRVPLALQMLPAIPLATLTFLLPESPRWLAAAGRSDDALKSLARLHARGDTNDTFVLAQLAEIEREVTDQKASEAKWLTFVTDKQAARKVLLGIALQFSVQMTGVSARRKRRERALALHAEQHPPFLAPQVSALQYYSPTIFASMGFSANKTLLLQSFNSIVALAGELACVLFIDKLGRRGPLIGANMIAGLSFLIATILQARFPNTGPNFSSSAAIAFVAMTWLFNLVFSAGIGPLSWAIPVEMFNTGQRAKATAMTSMAAW